MKHYAAYLFDADGTLIDTTELIYQCFVYTCRKFAGMELSRPEVVKHVGLTLRRHLELYLGPLSDEGFRTTAAAHMEYQMSIYPQYLRAFPGVLDALSALRAQHRTLAVVTSRRTESLTVYLRQTGLSGFFDCCVTPEDTTEHKPHPEPAQRALALLGVAARDALFVGDSSFDMECGASAGCDTAFVTWSHITATSLASPPTWLIDDMRELVSTPA
jgi:pyrophosphatase PpaX